MDNPIVKNKTKKTDKDVDIIDSPPTFAASIGVSAQSVRNWIKAGNIPLLINQGHTVRFYRSAALKSLNNKKTAQ